MHKIKTELKYKLEKEDYMDWIHWNVGRQNLKRVQRITLIVYVIFLVLYIGGNLASRRNPIALLPTIIMMTALGIFMFYTVSAKHQEQVIWKRSGLKKLEKTGEFPTVLLTVKDEGLTMEVPGEVRKDYSYADIREIQELDRLFLLAVTSDNTWQFVAKSAFESDAQRTDFRNFVEEKIQDAKENPDKYRIVEERASADAANGGSGISLSKEHISVEDDTDDLAPIEPVDTSRMGKIGKMAHIMAAMKIEEEDAPENNEEDND